MRPIECQIENKVLECGPPNPWDNAVNCILTGVLVGLTVDVVLVVGEKIYQMIAAYRRAND